MSPPPPPPFRACTISDLLNAVFGLAGGSILNLTMSQAPSQPLSRSPRTSPYRSAASTPSVQQVVRAQARNFSRTELRLLSFGRRLLHAERAPFSGESISTVPIVTLDWLLVWPLAIISRVVMTIPPLPHVSTLGAFLWSSQEETKNNQGFP